MKLNKLSFEVSTNPNHICINCGDHFDGKEGFLSIAGYYKKGDSWAGYPSDFKRGICMFCIKKLFGTFEKFEKEKEKIYNHKVKVKETRIKKTIIKGLR